MGRRARLLPAIGESGRPARAAHRRLSRRRARPIVRRAVHGAAADELLAGLRARLARRPPVRAARGAATRAGAREADLARGTSDRARGSRALARLRRRSRGSCFAEGRAVCDGVDGRLRYRAAAHLARRPPHPRPRRARPRAICCDQRPTLGAGDVPGAALARGALGRRRRPDGAQDQLLLLVPRAARRSAPGHHRRLGFLPRRGRCGGRGGDVARRPAARPSRFWRAELARCYRRAARRETPQGAQLQPFIAPFDLPRQAFEDVIDGVAMDLDTTRYETFDDLLEYCRRVASAVGLICIRIFGCRDAAARASTR